MENIENLYKFRIGNCRYCNSPVSIYKYTEEGLEKISEKNK